MSLTSAAHAQTANYPSVTEALSAGVRRVCLQTFILAAQLRAGVIAEDDARHLAGGLEGWAPTESLPAGVVPHVDERTIYLRADIPPGDAKVVAAIGISSTSPNCALVVQNDPHAAPNAIQAFRNEFTPLLTPSVSSDAGIDMFGLRIADRGPDLGVTVYTPLTQPLRDIGVGAMVNVGWIPRQAIDTGVFDPRPH
jgi:hypothetical protein